LCSAASGATRRKFKPERTGDKVAGVTCLKIQSPALLEPGFSLTLFLQGEFDGRISFDGFATAKNFVIGY